MLYLAEVVAETVPVPLRLLGQIDTDFSQRLTGADQIIHWDKSTPHAAGRLLLVKLGEGGLVLSGQELTAADLQGFLAGRPHLNLQISILAQQLKQVQSDQQQLDTEQGGLIQQDQFLDEAAQNWRQLLQSSVVGQQELVLRRAHIRSLQVSLVQSQIWTQALTQLRSLLRALDAQAQPEAGRPAAEIGQDLADLLPRLAKLAQDLGQQRQELARLQTAFQTAQPEASTDSTLLATLTRQQQLYQYQEVQFVELCRQLETLQATWLATLPTPADGADGRVSDFWRQPFSLLQTWCQQQDAYCQQHQAEVERQLQHQEQELRKVETSQQQITLNLDQTWANLKRRYHALRKQEQAWAGRLERLRLYQELLLTLEDRLHQAQTLLDDGRPLDLGGWLLTGVWGVMANRASTGSTVPPRFFEGLTPEESDKVLAAGTLVTYTAGDCIIQAQTEGDEVFLIQSGLVEVRSPQGSGLAILGPGRVFGEVSLITGIRRTADVIALDESRLVRLDRQNLQHLMTTSPPLAAKVFLNLSRLLAERLGQ